MSQSSDLLQVDHFVRGKLVRGGEVEYASRDLGVSFATPRIQLNELVTPRAERPPLLDVPLAEIIDFLVCCGERLHLDTNTHLQEALELTVNTNLLPRRIVENLYRSAPYLLNKAALNSMVESSFINPAALDGWVEREDVFGNRGAMRAFPPRMVHMLAGNAPAGCLASIAQGALVKGINVFKMPSSDPFTCVAILKTMAEIDPEHPVVKSMSAVYWRGGDQAIEPTLYRPQYFDRIVAWGGGDAINNVIRYLGPGLQLVSFDPKTSISMIGPEGFMSEEVINRVAESAAEDVTVYNQEACLASRYIFVEGERDGIEQFCSRLQQRLGVDREMASAVSHPPSQDIREQVEMLKIMDDEVKVWGKADGRGMVILSEDPVDFHPSAKTANVVHVSSLDDAVRHVTVATQTVGVYPAERKQRLRDRLASAGAQRVARLGSANRHVLGGPHDAMFPLQRFVHWISDEDA